MWVYGKYLFLDFPGLLYEHLNRERANIRGGPLIVADSTTRILVVLCIDGKYFQLGWPIEQCDTMYFTKSILSID